MRDNLQYITKDTSPLPFAKSLPLTMLNSISSDSDKLRSESAVLLSDTDFPEHTLFVANMNATLAPRPPPGYAAVASEEPVVMFEMVTTPKVILRSTLVLV